MGPHEEEAARVDLREVYALAEADVAGRHELFCELSGRCCRFEDAGHQLYLTALEYAEMVAKGGDRAADPAACPWFLGGLCANREGRALACRTYFCSDEASAAEVTEKWHRVIRKIHDDHGLEYRYRSLHDHMNPGR